MSDVRRDRFAVDADRALRLLHEAMGAPKPERHLTLVIPLNRTTTAAAGTRHGDSRRRPQKESR